MSYVVDVGYALDLSQIGAAINKFKELQKEVGKTDKALNSMGKSAGSSSEAKRTKEMKDLGSAAEGASKKVKQVGESAAQAGDKFDKLIEKNQLVRQYMVDGFTKGEAKILATAKQAGILESQFASLQHTLLQVAKLSSDPFDNSRGSIRALEKDITSLRDRMELSAKGIYANSNQMRLFGRAAEEVRGEIEKLGIKLDSPEGQVEYNKRLGERREKLTALIRETNNLNEVERQAQRIAKENQRILERTASVERRMLVRQTSKEFGVNLQDASFILDAKATGNMQLYNKALESTRKTMLETIPVATTLKTLIPAIGAVGGVAFLAQATREFLKMADSMRLVEARINLVSTAGADASQVLDQLVEISKENRVNLDTTSRLYTRLVPAMESFKVNLEGAASATDAALKVTKAFGAALLISGANTQEAIAATTQFTQAMASGKLAGDEFRSVSEAAPAFLKAIADGSGYARSELKALSSEGKLTTELISQALLKMQSSLEAKAAKVPVTMGQAFERVKTDLMVFSRDLNESTGAVDGVVSAIETLGIVIQGLGSGLAMMKEAVDPLNDSLNGMGTSLGQLLFAASSVYALSKVLASVIGVAGIAGAATTAGGALVTATVAMRGYAAATAISIAATGTLSTALFAARGAVLALGAALASTPIGVILAGAATAAGILYFNSEQAAVQISKLAEEKEGSIKSTKVLLESEEKLAKSWDELINKAPEVGQAIQKSFDSSGVKFLTDDQQRELEESMKRIQKLREDVSKDNLSGRERVEKNELIVALKKEYDARYRTFALQQQIDMFNSTSDGAASDMIKKLQDEVKQREQVNKLLREGVSLRKAELIAAGMAAIQQQYGTPTIMPGEGPIQFEARKLSIKRQIAEQEATLFGYADKVTTLEKEQAAILDSQKKSKKEKTNSLLEELQALEKLLPLAKQIGDVEKARLIAGGISAEQAQRLLDLRKQIQVLEGTQARADETALAQRELELLLQGLTVEQTKSILEKESLERAMVAKGYSEQEIQDRLEILSLTKALSDADKERQEAVQKLQETYAEFVAPEKLEIGDLFGDAAQGAGVLLNTMYDIAAQQEEIAKRKELINKSGLKEQALEKELMAIQKKQSANELSNMRAVAGGAKQLFKEKSTAYKVLERLEQAMFIMQLYNQKAEIAAFITGVATKVAGYATTALAAGKAAIASSLIAPPPANFASLAAVLAVLGGIGLAISGARGKGKDDAMPVYNEGKGTVLGDSSAQSESIKKSIEALEKYAKVELPITSQMLQSLRNIESSVSGLGNLVARSAAGIGSSLTSNVKQGTTLSSTSLDVMNIGKIVGAVKTIGVLGDVSSIISLFTSASGVGALVTIASAVIPSVGKAVDKVIGSIVGGIFGKVSTKVIGSGLTANIQTVKQVLEEGFNLLEYVDIRIKKKSWFGSSSKVATITTKADKELSDQFTKVFTNIYASIIAAAAPLGANLDVVTKTLDKFQIKIGKINLRGLSAEEIQKKLEAVFGQQSDLMAKAALPGFEEFQRVGEGYFQTITRTASGLEAARNALEKLGITAVDFMNISNKQGDVDVELFRESVLAFENTVYGAADGIYSIVEALEGSLEDINAVYRALNTLRDSLLVIGKSVNSVSSSMVQGAGDFGRLSAGVESFFSEFLSDEENLYRQSLLLAKEFGRVGVTMPKTREEFVKLVEGIDTSTEAGQKLFGAVIALSPAFAELQSSMDDLAEEASKVNDEISSLLSEITKARADAESELKKAYDEQKKVFESSVATFDKFISSLKAFREELTRGQTALLSPKAQLEADRAAFEDTASKALAGDVEALGKLEAVSEDYLKASKDYYASSGQYFDDLERVKDVVSKSLDSSELQKTVAESQLQELRNVVGSLIRLEDSQLTVEMLKAAFPESSQVVEAIDRDDDSIVSSQEAALSALLSGNKDTLALVAKVIEGSGDTTVDELRKSLEGKASAVDIESVVYAIDSDGNKVVSAFEVEMATLQASNEEIVKSAVALSRGQFTVRQAIDNLRFVQTIENLSIKAATDAGFSGIIKGQNSTTASVNLVYEVSKRILEVLGTNNAPPAEDTAAPGQGTGVGEGSIVPPSDVVGDAIKDAAQQQADADKAIQDAIDAALNNIPKLFLQGLVDFNINGVVSAIEIAASEGANKVDTLLGTVGESLKLSKRTQFTSAELKSALSSVASEDDIAALIKAVDKSGDGIITQSELTAYTNQRLTDLLASSSKLRGTIDENFNKIDKNLDGVITASEMQAYLKQELGVVASSSQIAALIAAVDASGNKSLEKLDLIADSTKRAYATATGKVIGEADAKKLSEEVLVQLGKKIDEGNVYTSGYAGSTEAQLERAISEFASVSLEELKKLNIGDITALAKNLGITNSYVKDLSANVVSQFIGEAALSRLSSDIAQTVGSAITAASSTQAPTNVAYGSVTEQKLEAGLASILKVGVEDLISLSLAELRNLAKHLKVDSGVFSAYALGGVFSGGSEVVSSPTKFNIGLMGESGPEAIMPLSRGSDGSLGVRVVGGVSSNAPVVAAINESSKHTEALVRLQQAANQKIIEKLSDMEERLDGIESKARLEAAR